jgi:hypothetical protein
VVLLHCRRLDRGCMRVWHRIRMCDDDSASLTFCMHFGTVGMRFEYDDASDECAPSGRGVCESRTRGGTAAGDFTPMEGEYSDALCSDKSY